MTRDNANKLHQGESNSDKKQQHEQRYYRSH